MRTRRETELASESRVKRALMTFGLAGPIVYAAVVIVLGALEDRYSHVRDSMSELGAVDARFPELMNRAGFMLLGVAILAFAAGYYLQFRPGGWALAAAGLLNAAGVFMVAVGFFPCDPGCIDVTATGRIHSLTSTPQAVALPLAALVSTRVFRSSGRLGAGWQLFSFWTGIVALSTGPLVGLDLVEGVSGLVQRIGMGFSLVWMAAVALKLRAPTGGPPPAPHGL